MKIRRTAVKIYMRRMQMITVVSVVVMASVFIFLTLWQNYQYDNIISNLTKATEFNFDFKSNIDYKMYRIVIGADTFESLTPYEDLEHSRHLFGQLRDSTEYKESKKGLDGLLILVDILEARIQDIEEVDIYGNYDENIRRLEHDIYIITDLIEEKMSEYIYNETKTLENIRGQLEQRVTDLIIAGLILSGGLFLFLFRSFGVLSRKITNPIEALCEHTAKFADGHMESNAPESDIMEMQMLSDQYDSMTDRIRELITHIREEQEHQRRTELMLLQSQINPHFLYNTLDAIVWLAEGKKYQEVVEMITALSAFLRIGLSKGYDSIRIEDEISHVRNYLQIQRFRYEDILDYRIDADDAILNEYIPKLTLQPIVENALYHGIKNKRGKGLLVISGWLERGSVATIQIEDNGIGMKPERLEQLRRMLSSESDQDSGYSDNGFGLKNVAERIRLKYGGDYGILIESEYLTGTVVTVRIPVKDLI
ncbi:MAG: sensor histidine kinase [Lachnospiraceae bacterium]